MTLAALRVTSLRVAILALLGTVSLAQAADRSPVRPALRQQAVEALRHNLDQDDAATQARAARYLLSLGYSDNIAARFRNKLSQSESDPAARVDLWTVLARTVEAEHRRPWIDKLLGLALTGRPEEQLAAAQGLAQLGDPLSETQWKSLEALLPSARGPLLPVLQWIGLNSDAPTAEAALAALLGSDDPAVRAAAADALRHRATVAESTQRALLTAAQHEATDSPARAALVAAAAIHNPGEAWQGFGLSLRDYAQTGNDAERVVAFEALARIATPDDVPHLNAGLDSPSPEVRAAVAWAILRVGRRVAPGLGSLDWSIIGLYLLGMLAVGWYYAQRNASPEEYLLGNRRMKPVNVGLSLFAGLVSVLSYLAWPGEVIKYGPLSLFVYAAFPLVYLVVGYLLIPVIMRLQVTSAYELLEARLGLGVRMLGSCFFLALRIGWMAALAYATIAKVLVPLTGLPPAATPWLCAALTLITLCYTTLGGIRAVVVTDVIQALLLLAGAVVTLGVISVQLGGMTAWWPTAWVAHWPTPVWTFHPTARVTALGATLGCFLWWVCTAGSDQMAIQRYLATRDARAARRAMAITLTADFVVGMLLAALGLALLSYFRANPQWLPDGPSLYADSDQLFPRFIAIGLPVGFSGLVIAGLLAATMSSLSAGLSACCSVITVDFLDRFRRSTRPVNNPVRRLRWVSLLVGLVVVVLSSFVGLVHGNLLELCYKVVNLLTAPLFGLFFLAIFVRWATGFGTLLGAGFGVATVVAVNYWKELTGTPGISFFWGIPLSLAVQITVGALVSLLPIGRRNHHGGTEFPEEVD